MRIVFKILKSLIILVITGGVIAGGYFLVTKTNFFKKPEKKDELLFANVERGDITLKLNVKGNTKPFKSTIITAPSRGGKITYLIPEGMYAKQGDLLVQFDKVDLEKAVTDAEYDVEQQTNEEERRAHEADKKITQTKLRLQESRESLRAIIPQVLDGKKNVDDLNWAKYNLKEADINYTLAKKDYQQYLIKGSPQLRQAKDRLRKAKDALAEADILSPAPGLVVYETIYRGGSGGEKIKPGDSFWRNQSILSLPDLSKMLVIVEVSEVDLSKVEIGQKCTIKIDAYQDKTFTGEVTNKGNLVKDSVFIKGVKIVEVEITIDGENSYLRPGMTATVDIGIGTLRDVIYVPLTGVFEYDNKYYCYLVENEKYIKKEVEVGESSNDKVVIIDGLKENQKITLFDPYRKK